ncbi:MAG: hypothetical protein WCK37_04720 [Candidatus Falkowbacteria bacterium]
MRISISISMATLCAVLIIVNLCAFIENHNFFFMIGSAGSTLATMGFTLDAIEKMINNAVANKPVETKRPKSE